MKIVKHERKEDSNVIVEVERRNKRVEDSIG